MRHRRRINTARMLVWLTLLALVGCGPRVPVEVRAWGEPATALPDMQRFAISHQLAGAARADRLDRQVAEALQRFFVEHGYLPVRDQTRLIKTSTDPARIRNVAAAARDTLDDNGFTPDPKDPHFLVSVDYSTGPYEYLVPGGGPEADDASASDSASTSASGSRSDRDPVAARAQQVEGNMLAPPGRRALTHVHGVAVYIYPARDPSEPVWWGSAISVKHQPDFPRVMPMLVEQALGEFPRASGKPRHRRVPLPGE